MATDSTAPEQAPEPPTEKEQTREDVVNEIFAQFAEDQGQARLWLRTRNERLKSDLDLATVLLAALGFPPPHRPDSVIPKDFCANDVCEDTADMIRSTLKDVLTDIRRQLKSGASLENVR